MGREGVHINQIEWFCAGFLTACLGVELFLIFTGPVMMFFRDHVRGCLVSLPDPNACAFCFLNYSLAHPLPERLLDLMQPNPIQKCKDSGHQWKSRTRQITEVGKGRLQVRYARQCPGGIQIQRCSRGSQNMPLSSRRNTSRSRQFSGFGVQSKGKRRQRKKRLLKK